jgi:N-acetylmuramoyl-L-alanine amidase
VCAAAGVRTHSVNKRPTARIEAIRFWSFGDVTRIAIQTEGDYKLKSDQIDKPARLYFDLCGIRPMVVPHKSKNASDIIHVNDRLVKQIRVAEVSPGVTRIVFDLEAPANVVSSQLVNPNRLMIEVRPKRVPPPNISVARSVAGSKPVVVPVPPEKKMIPVPQPEISTVGRMDSPVENGSDALAVKLEPRRSAPPPAPVREPADAANIAASSKAISHSKGKHRLDDVIAAQSDSSGDRSLVRVFGLKLGKVVIDAGHGGHDTGTIGPHGLMEKDLALDVALRLGRLISTRLGADVVYTRSDDVFIPLEERTRIANNEKADLFISIHANSSPEPSASGVETYYFNFTADRSSLDLATRENATAASSISDLGDLLHKAVLMAKADESREFAQKVQAALWPSSNKMDKHSRDRGVRQAPFVVLIGATMPSILAEIGFVSNPHDEKLLRRSDERERIAEALYKGIAQYASSLSHMQVAQAE